MEPLIVFGASHLYLVSGVVAGAYFVSRDRDTQKKIVIVGLFSGSISLLIATVANRLIQNPRPFVADNFIPLVAHAPDNGFPSDHSLLVGFIASLIFVFDRRVGALLWIVAVAVGTARVLAGVHHPVDVIGSFLIAAASVTVVTKMVARLKK